MASVIITPVSDTSLEHEITAPSDQIDAYTTGASAICDINETEISTGIVQILSSITVTTPEICTSKFVISDINNIEQITSAKLHLLRSIGTDDLFVSDTYSIKIDNENIDVITNSYHGQNNPHDNKIGQESFDLTNLASKIMQYKASKGRFPTITLEVKSEMYSINPSAKDGLNTIGYMLGYIYIELIGTRDASIHFKQNGSWVTVKQIFRKTSGSWKEITVEECKTLLQ